MKYFILSFLTASSVILQGCGLGYYSHLARGQYDLMKKREPIQDVIISTTANNPLKERLLLTQKALDFSEKNLQIKVKSRYTGYVDLQRPYVIWSLSATPELSFKAYKWCYPIVGCANYRGYFDYERAHKAELELQQQGYETYLRGVSAYSTLGWFSDPVINTFVNYSEKEYLILIFHELAHSRLYIKNDTRFNESFATFVGEQAYRDFKKLYNLQEPMIDRKRKESYEDLKKLILKYRAQLLDVYKSNMSSEQKRQAKNKVMQSLQTEYNTIKQTWPHNGYDQWIHNLNNAKLMVYSDYESKVPMFEELFKSCEQDWACFYTKAQEMGKSEK